MVSQNSSTGLTVSSPALIAQNAFGVTTVEEEEEEEEAEEEEEDGEAVEREAERGGERRTEGTTGNSFTEVPVEEPSTESSAVFASVVTISMAFSESSKRRFFEDEERSMRRFDFSSDTRMFCFSIAIDSSSFSNFIFSILFSLFTVMRSNDLFKIKINF